MWDISTISALAVTRIVFLHRREPMWCHMVFFYERQVVLSVSTTLHLLEHQQPVF